MVHDRQDTICIMEHVEYEMVERPKYKFPLSGGRGVRKNTKEAKETTRRLIKAGLAVGILGGGAATAQVDAFADTDVTTEADAPETTVDVTPAADQKKTDPVTEFYNTVDGYEKNDQAENKSSSDKYDENIQSLATDLGVDTTDLTEGDSQIIYTGEDTSMSISAIQSEATSQIASEQAKTGSEYAKAEDAYNAADQYLTEQETSKSEAIETAEENLKEAKQTALEKDVDLNGEKPGEDRDGDKVEGEKGAVKAEEEAQERFDKADATLYGEEEGKDENGNGKAGEQGAKKDLEDAKAATKKAEDDLGVEGPTDIDGDGKGGEGTEATDAYKTLADAQKEVADEKDKVDAAEKALNEALKERSQESKATYSSSIVDVHKQDSEAIGAATKADSDAKALIDALGKKKEAAIQTRDAIEKAFGKETASGELTAQYKAADDIVKELDTAITNANAQYKDVNTLASAYNQLLYDRAFEVAYWNFYKDDNNGSVVYYDTLLAKDLIKYSLTQAGYEVVGITDDNGSDRRFQVSYKDGENTVTKTIDYTIDKNTYDEFGDYDSGHWLNVNEVVETPKTKTVTYYTKNYNNERFEEGDHNVKQDKNGRLYYVNFWGTTRYVTKHTQEVPDGIKTTRTEVCTEYKTTYSEEVVTPAQADLEKINKKIKDYNDAKKLYDDAVKKETAAKEALEKAKKALADAQTAEGTAQKKYDDALKEYNAANTALENATTAKTNAETAKNNADAEVTKYYEELNGKTTDGVYESGLYKGSEALHYQHVELAERWSEYDSNFTVNSGLSKATVIASEKISERLVYSETPAPAPTSENPSTNNDNGNDNDTSVSDTQEERGSVLGANREQPTGETETVAVEEGKVLGAERGRSPKTNDAANVLGAVATMGSSLVGAGAVLGLRRRNK